MSDINPNSANYTKEQVDFATEMAKFLAKKKGFQMDSKMAVLPGSWKYNVPDIMDKLAQGRYQNQAMQGADTLINKPFNNNYQSPIGNTTLGGQISSGLGSVLKSMWGGIKNNIPGNSSAPPSDDKSLETGSLNPEAPKEDSSLTDPEIGSGELKPAEGESPVNSKYIRKLIEIESGGDPYAKTGSNRGLGQFGPNEEVKYGINDSNRHLPEVQHKAIAQSAEENRAAFKREFGREPTQGELYIMHQQGQTGGIQLIKNPDKSAIDVVSPYYRNRAVARSAIAGNLPKGSMVDPDTATAKDFTSFWTSRFDRAAGGDKTAGEPLPGMMRLGGPQEGDATEKTMTPLGDQVAQAMPGYTSTPVTTPNKGQPQNVPGGYQGVVPPAGPLESQEQLINRLRAADPSERKAIMDDYMKRAKGDTYDTQGGGKLRVTPSPGGAQPTVTHIPGADIPLSIGGMGLHLRQNPNGGFDVIMPGGGSGGHLKDMSLDELNRLGARLTADRKSVEDIGAAQTKPITEQIEQSTVAPARAQTLQTLEALVKANPDLSMGPTSPYFNEAKRLIANFFPKLDVKGIEAADSIEKLNSLLASESTKLFTNRGTNFDLQTFMNANPNLRQSRGGMLMMIDLLKQETEQSKELGRIANGYKNKNVDSWNDRKEEYYNDHPLIIKEPIGEGKFRQITTKKITSKEERDALPKDMGYIDPNGEIRFRH